MQYEEYSKEWHEERLRLEFKPFGDAELDELVIRFSLLSPFSVSEDAKRVEKEIARRAKAAKSVIDSRFAVPSFRWDTNVAGDLIGHPVDAFKDAKPYVVRRVTPGLIDMSVGIQPLHEPLHLHISSTPSFDSIRASIDPAEKFRMNDLYGKLTDVADIIYPVSSTSAASGYITDMDVASTYWHSHSHIDYINLLHGDHDIIQSRQIQDALISIASTTANSTVMTVSMPKQRTGASDTSTVMYDTESTWDLSILDNFFTCKDEK